MMEKAVEYRKAIIQNMKEAVEEIITYNQRVKGRSKIKHEYMVADLAKCGEHYKDSRIRLMVIGRAAGKISVEPEKWLSDVGNGSLEYYFDLAQKDQLEWLASRGKKGEKRIGKKPFYKLVGDIVNELLPEETKGEDGLGWVPYIARTNFYNITYFNSDSNPNKALIQAQHPAMLKILECDLNYFDPTHILIITNSNWPDEKNFQDFMNIIRSRQGDCKIAVTERPEFKNCKIVQENMKKIWEQFQ